MTTESNALAVGDQLVQELATPTVKTPAETMGRLQKLSYSHKAMIDLILEHPDWDQNKIAGAFGYTPSWVSNILASEAFQAQMASRREEIIDPALKASIEERFRALVIQSLAVLQKKLEQPVVSDNVALRAAELGAKALGIGGHAPPKAPVVNENRLLELAANLEKLQRRSTERTIDGEATVIQAAG